MTIRSIRVIYVKNIAKTSSFSRNSAFPPLCPLKQRLRTSNPPIPRKPVNPRNKRAKERRREQTSKRFPYSSLPLYIKRCLARDSLRAETSRGTTKAAIQSAVRIEPHPSCTEGGGKERRGKDARTQTAYCFSLELISRNGFAKNRRRRMRTRRVYNNSLVQNRERKRGGILFGARKEWAGNRSRPSAVLLSRLAFMKYPRHSFHTDSPAARRVHS